MKSNNHFAVAALKKVLSTRYNSEISWKERESDIQKKYSDRKKAAEYFAQNYSREQRYLIIFARDFQEYLKSGNWLKTDEAKKEQKYFDFLGDFKNLKTKMQEFRWTKDFLLAHGIDFPAIRSLYFAVA